MGIVRNWIVNCPQIGFTDKMAIGLRGDAKYRKIQMHTGPPHLLYTRDVLSSARYKVHDVHTLVHRQFCVDEFDACTRWSII